MVAVVESGEVGTESETGTVKKASVVEGTAEEATLVVGTVEEATVVLGSVEKPSVVVKTGKQRRCLRQMVTSSVVDPNFTVVSVPGVNVASVPGVKVVGCLLRILS